ncbi:MAG: hypothetical protein LBU41_05020 [Clostridiales Family XIII bacterium]|nr:hypothetical protein [Clostridiales Family XIII bacterium]
MSDKIYLMNMKWDDEGDYWSVTCRDLPDFSLDIEMVESSAELIQFAVSDYLQAKGEDPDVQIKILIETVEREKDRDKHL